jgi:hypothetical protein
MKNISENILFDLRSPARPHSLDYPRLLILRLNILGPLFFENLS